jgi:acyl-CoA-binding protein
MSAEDLTNKFEQAAKDAQNLTRRPDDQTLLKLYALYKQSTRGDISGRRPGFTDPVGRAKFDAWSKLKGTSSEAAMEKYIALVEKIKA